MCWQWLWRLIASMRNVSHKPRCRVRQFGPKCKWKTTFTTFCTKSCRCHKTISIDLLTRYPNCGIAALWTRQFTRQIFAFSISIINLQRSSTWAEFHFLNANGSRKDQSMWAERERRISRSALQPISITPAHRSVPASRPPAPRSAPLHWFSATPAHRSAHYITTGSCRSTTTSDDCKARLVRFPCKTRYIRIPGFSF